MAVVPCQGELPAPDCYQGTRPISVGTALQVEKLSLPWCPKSWAFAIVSPFPKLLGTEKLRLLSFSSSPRRHSRLTSSPSSFPRWHRASPHASEDPLHHGPRREAPPGPQRPGPASSWGNSLWVKAVPGRVAPVGAVPCGTSPPLPRTCTGFLSLSYVPFCTNCCARSPPLLAVRVLHSLLGFHSGHLTNPSP